MVRSDGGDSRLPAHRLADAHLPHSEPMIVGELQRHRRQVGSIVLEIQDFKTHQLIWKAEAQDVLDDAATPEDSQQDVSVAVTRMLGQFPPKAPAS